jgi:hypothetical protein
MSAARRVPSRSGGEAYSLYVESPAEGHRLILLAQPPYDPERLRAPGGTLAGS